MRHPLSTSAVSRRSRRAERRIRPVRGGCGVPAVIDALLLVRLPYHLSAQTQATARAALAHAPALLATVAGLRAERDALVGWLRGRGLAAADSDANFCLLYTSDAADE